MIINIIGQHWAFVFSCLDTVVLAMNSARSIAWNIADDNSFEETDQFGPLEKLRSLTRLGNHRSSRPKTSVSRSSTASTRKQLSTAGSSASKRLQFSTQHLFLNRYSSYSSHVRKLGGHIRPGRFFWIVPWVSGYRSATHEELKNTKNMPKSLLKIWSATQLNIR